MLDSKYICENLKDVIKQLEKRNDDFSFFNKEGKDYIIYGVRLHNQFPDMFKNIKDIEYLHPSMRKRMPSPLSLTRA